MKKVLPKKVNKNKGARVTNVHGSMEGQDILKLAESIEKDKDNIKRRRRQFRRKF